MIGLSRDKTEDATNDVALAIPDAGHRHQAGVGAESEGVRVGHQFCRIHTPGLLINKMSSFQPLLPITCQRFPNPRRRATELAVSTQSLLNGETGQ